MKLKDKARAAWELATGRRLVELLLGHDQLAGRALPGRAVPGKAAPKRAGVSTAAPRGWLGYTLMHGAACFAFTQKYILENAHLTCDLDANHQHTSPYADINANAASLMTNRFCEAPCPSIVRNSPRFLGGSNHDPWKFTHADNMHTVAEAAWAGSCSNFADWGCYNGINVDLEMWVEDYTQWSMATAIWVEWLKIDPGDGKCYITPGNYSTGPSGEKYDIHPGHNVREYITTSAEEPRRVDGKSHFYGSTFDSITTHEERYRQLVCPAYWRATTARQKKWWRRIVRWYYTAAWVVWCGEMMRLHAGETCYKEAPDWWREHCLRWGITVPTHEQQHDRLHFFDDNDGLWIHHADFTEQEMWQHLERIVDCTPPPGTAGATGEQIVSDEVHPDGSAIYHRHILDIPPQAGAIAPPLALRDWMTWTALTWNNSVDHDTLYDHFAPYIKAVCNTLMSAMTAGAASSITTTLTTVMSETASKIVMQVATILMQKVFLIVKEGDIDFDAADEFGDVVGLIGSAVESVGVGQGIDLKTVPDDLWANLKTAGAQLEAFGDWSENAPTLYAIQSTLTDLAKGYGWDYFDEAYGGMGLNEEAKTAAQ